MIQSIIFCRQLSHTTAFLADTKITNRTTKESDLTEFKFFRSTMIRLVAGSKLSSKKLSE